jgi:hypothetical protein
MKFSNDTELRFGKVKHSKVMIGLLGIGCVFGILSWCVGASAKDWVEGISNLAFAVGLLVFLSDMVAERKEWQAKQKTETK